MSEEWLSWGQALGVVRAAGLGPRTWADLAALCATGQIETKATIIINGEASPSELIDKEIWKVARDHVSPRGALRMGKDEDSAMIVGFEFRADDLAKVFPQLSAEKFAAAIALAEPTVPSAKSGANMVPKPGANGGKKPELQRWQVFYFAAIELAKEGRLTKDHFPSQAALREELLEMMGSGAFSEDHVKAQAAQIYKKFIGNLAD